MPLPLPTLVSDTYVIYGLDTCAEKRRLVRVAFRCGASIEAKLTKQGDTLCQFARVTASSTWVLRMFAGKFNEQFRNAVLVKVDGDNQPCESGKLIEETGKRSAF
jgi:hypothetical protein